MPVSPRHTAHRRDALQDLRWHPEPVVHATALSRRCAVQEFRQIYLLPFVKREVGTEGPPWPSQWPRATLPDIAAPGTDVGAPETSARRTSRILAETEAQAPSCVKAACTGCGVGRCRVPILHPALTHKLLPAERVSHERAGSEPRETVPRAVVSVVGLRARPLPLRAHSASGLQSGPHSDPHAVWDGHTYLAQAPAPHCPLHSVTSERPHPPSRPGVTCTHAGSHCTPHTEVMETPQETAVTLAPVKIHPSVPASARTKSAAL